MMMGICGKQGSGKSTLTKLLLAKYNNSIYIDIDKIGHNIYNNNKVRKNIVKYFGDNIITNNKVNRKLLGNIVFNNKNQMDILTNITWPYMEKSIDNIIKQNTNKLIILDWQLLPKTKYFNLCDIKILLDIPYEIRKKRVIERDKITNEYFDIRDRSSYNYDNLDFDYIIKETNINKIKKWVKKL